MSGEAGSANGDAGSGAIIGSEGGTGGEGSADIGVSGGRGTGGELGMGGAVGTGGAAACTAPIAITSGTAVTVTVNLGATPMGTVSPDLLGVHTAVYSTSLSSPGLPTALKTAGVGSLRYPGGAYADVFFWDTYTAYTTAPAQGFGSNVITVNPGSDVGRFVALLEASGANAFITVNYGSRPDGMGGGVPQQAAAWVAYANALPTNTAVIGVDASGHDWGMAADWASLRAASPLVPDDGRNFLRIAHPDPLAIKYWEVGNEVFGNGFYSTGQCWEVDLHAPYVGNSCAGRPGSATLGPAIYGAGVVAFSRAMKAVDPTVKVGAVLHWPLSFYPNWDTAVLQQSCESIDFIVTHWYPGTSVTDLLTRARTDIPTMFRDLRAIITPANGCTTKTAETMSIAVTEWAPNQLTPAIATAINPVAPVLPTHTQIAGIFVAETYANLMDQGGMSAHLAEMYPAASGVAFLDGANVPTWGYHGMQMNHLLASGGETVVSTTSTVARLLTHAVLRSDGGVNVMLTNTSGTVAANVTVELKGGASTLACVGSRWTYAPAAGGSDMDGAVSAPEAIFSMPGGTSVPVGVPAYAVVVISFPGR